MSNSDAEENVLEEYDSDSDEKLFLSGVGVKEEGVFPRTVTTQNGLLIRVVFTVDLNKAMNFC